MSGRLKILAVHRASRKWKVVALILLIIGGASLWSHTSFYRAVNLGGSGFPAGEDTWEGGSATGVFYDGQFSLHNTEFRPPPAKELHMKIALLFGQKSRNGRNRVIFKDVPDGEYQVTVYAVKSGDASPSSISLKGQEVLSEYQFPEDENWGKLGPWITRVTDGTISVTSRGDSLVLAGLEIRRRNSIPDWIYRNLLSGSSIHSRNFDEVIGPLLGKRCANCHNAADLKGGLDVSNRDTILDGGESGPAVRLGKPEESLLWQHIQSDTMPPDEPLTNDEKQQLHEWIANEIPWGDKDIPRFVETTKQKAGTDWWSFQPLKSTDPSRAKNTGWGNNAIDSFVFSKLHSNGITPSKEADKRTLIRRLYFDVLGLPPTPDQVEAFLADDSQKAYENLVDSILNSPHYGERWARHWLDVVRFGESQGFQRNWLRPNAWKYRDWVILALNNDMPYDEFVRLQVAGDLISPQDPAAAIATGFLVAGMFDMEGITSGPALMRTESRQQELADIVGTLGQSFLGLTVQCARCHDHKFDPITQQEYYQLLATISSIRLSSTESESVNDLPDNIALKQKSELKSQIESLKAELGTSESEQIPEYDPKRLALSNYTMRFRLLESSPIFAASPDIAPDPVWIYRRGDVRQPIALALPSGLQRIGLPDADFGLTTESSDRERRLKLANWLTKPNSPLLARVIVNRIWQHHFGTGLIETPNDFGFNGAPPTHPQLLDWLANKLIENGWSLKSLHRLILLSATWKQSSKPREDAIARDAENRLYWRYTPKRHEAEIVRDTMLAISGQLDKSMGGPGYRDFDLVPHTEKVVVEAFTPKDVFGPEFNRRTIYRTWVRGGGNSLLESLDCPSASTTAPRRLVTTTPLQALSLLNNNFTRKAAASFAKRLEQETDTEPQKLVELAYQLVFSRSPTAEEQSSAVNFINEFGLKEFCLVLFNCNEFLFVD